MSFHPQIYLLDGIDLVVNYSQLDQINLQFCVSHQISPLMTGAKNIFLKNFCMNAEKKMTPRILNQPSTVLFSTL